MSNAMQNSDEITLRAMTERLEAGPWMSLKTNERVLQKAEHIQQAFGPDIPIGNITQQDVTSYRDELLHKYAPSTTNRYLDTLRQLFAEASLFLPRAQVPVVGRVYESSKTSVRILSEDEQARLLKFALRSCSPRWHLFLCVLLDLALRKSEALALTWDDIDLISRTVTIWKTKTNEPRTLPLSNRVYTGLKVLKAEEEISVGSKEQVFGYSLSQAERRWRKTRKLAYLRGTVMHSLRHTAASNLAASGCPINILQSYLGHKSISSTLRYAHMDVKALNLARDLINSRNAKASLNA